MGDTKPDVYRNEREGNAYNTFLEELINYLNSDQPMSKSAFEEKIEKIAAENGVAAEESKAVFQKIIDNDKEAWKMIADIEEKVLFSLRPDLRTLFYEAAKKRNIGSMQWVI
jgi:hypothetical protein